MTATPDQFEPPPGYEDVPHTRVRFRPRRRAIARAMTTASQIPSLTADVQVDLSAVLAARSEWNSDPVRAAEDRLSVLAFIATAAVRSLLDHPDLNATYTETALVRWDPVNLGIAVDTPAGLVVPVIRNAQQADVCDIGAAIRDFAERGRCGKLSHPELNGGTFTISNPGAVGPVLRAEALLNPPQVAMLGLPGIRRAPAVVTDANGAERIETRSIICPSLTFDHRPIDGGEAVRYLVTLKRRLETWALDDYLGKPS